MQKRHVFLAAAGLFTLLLLAVTQLWGWQEVSVPVRFSPAGSTSVSDSQDPRHSAVGSADVTVETLSGGDPGFRDGPAWQAQFCGPNALAPEPAGALLICDSRNHRLRRLSPDGTVSTVAGGGEPGGPGGCADGPAEEARFRYPSGVAIGPEGVVYLADTGNHRVCRIRDGRVSTFAGSPAGAAGNADGQGTGARFRSPAALTVLAGALWVADCGSRAVRRVDLSARVTTPAAVPAAVREALGDAAGSPRHGPVFAVEGRSTVPTETQFTVGSRGAACARWTDGRRTLSGARLFADTENHVLLMEYPDGKNVLVAGRMQTGGPQVGSRDGRGTEAAFAGPCATVTGADGTGYVAEYEGNRIRGVRLPQSLGAVRRD